MICHKIILHVFRSVATPGSSHLGASHLSPPGSTTIGDILHSSNQGTSLSSNPLCSDHNQSKAQEVAASPNPSPLDNWVTVWGFPPSSVSFIISGIIMVLVSVMTIIYFLSSELSVCGTVLQHIIHPNSNWMHVRMQTRWVVMQDADFMTLDASPCYFQDAG